MEIENKNVTCNKRENWSYLKIRKYLRNVPGKHDIKELQKTAIFGTAQIFG